MDIKHKKGKLSELKSEVSDFHPILEELFRNIPEIENVEYSHGNSEMGADFILYKHDKLFGTLDHIGVIVKLGSINQDNQDVDRQIEECSIERNFKISKTTGYLKEVWIITNGNISENAQRKIQEKYKTSKFRFIFADILIKLIDNYLPNYWDQLPIGISTYFQHELAICKSDDAKFSLIDNYPDLYISQDIIKSNKIRSIKKSYKAKKSSRITKKEIVNIYDEIDSNGITIVEGQIGSGKSKLLRKIFEKNCEISTYNQSRIFPIRLSFIDYINKYNSDADIIIDDIFKKYNNVKLSDINSFLLLIDGIDEYNPNYEEYLKVFNGAISRIKTFSKDKNIAYVFSIRETDSINDYTGLKNIKSYCIQPLSTEKLFELICSICNKISKDCRLLEDIKHSDLFRDLPSYPMSAILLAKLINDGEYKDLPMTITELYKKYSELCLGRWDIKRGLQKEQEYEIANKFTMLLADYMYENERISINELEASTIFMDYIKARNFENLNSEKLFSNIVERSGLFVYLENNSIVFKHRTFIDFFYAQYLHFKKIPIFDFNAWSPTFHNLVMFYIGIENDCLEILEKIITLEPNNDFERFYKPIALSDYFLAGYSTEYEVVKKSLGNVLLDFAKFYMDVINKRTILPFSILPEAYMLSLFQLIIRDKYSYEFFKNSLEDACSIIEESDISEELKIYTLYFIGCIKLEMKMLDPFDYLIYFHEKTLPNSIKLLVFKDTENILEQSTVLKKLTKHIKRELNKNNISYQYLLTKPIVKKQELEERLAITD